ncbi:DUF6171 family protein [Paenibacillus daejeonensis]|uniref:DUF6171 family protein n=1 Tax=Paenibacillus daejeonensis TaxID=135193 RepID=UPI0003633C3D|nr:DUF6171 family protein [Paenibacillus daejeonensis]
MSRAPETASGREPCKGCSADVKVSEEQMARLWERMGRLPAEDLAEPELYDERLALCRDCPSLQYGTTCQHCGCLVAWKAKLRRSRCPMPGAARW